MNSIGLPINDQCSHHIDTNQLIWRTVVVNRLISSRPAYNNGNIEEPMKRDVATSKGLLNINI